MQRSLVVAANALGTVEEVVVAEPRPHDREREQAHRHHRARPSHPLRGAHTARGQAPLRRGGDAPSRGTERKGVADHCERNREQQQQPDRAERRDVVLAGVDLRHHVRLVERERQRRRQPCHEPLGHALPALQPDGQRCPGCGHQHERDAFAARQEARSDQQPAGHRVGRACGAQRQRERERGTEEQRLREHLRGRVPRLPHLHHVGGEQQRGRAADERSGHSPTHREREQQAQQPEQRVQHRHRTEAERVEPRRHERRPQVVEAGQHLAVGPVPHEAEPLAHAAAARVVECTRLLQQRLGDGDLAGVGDGGGVQHVDARVLVAGGVAEAGEEQHRPDQQRGQHERRRPPGPRDPQQTPPSNREHDGHDHRHRGDRDHRQRVHSQVRAGERDHRHHRHQHHAAECHRLHRVDRAVGRRRIGWVERE